LRYGFVLNSDSIVRTQDELTGSAESLLPAVHGQFCRCPCVTSQRHSCLTDS